MTMQQFPKSGKGDSPHLPERPEGCCAQMGTVPFSAPTPELIELVGRLADGQLGGEPLARLLQLLRDDQFARDYYLDYMELHAQLCWKHSGVQEASIGGQVVASGEWRVESEADYPEIPKSLNHQIPTLDSRLSTLNSWAFSYAAATVLLAVALLGAWTYTITHPDADALAKANSWTVTPSSDAANDTPQFTFVGHVSGMVDCQWADPKTSTVAGAAVPLGRRYALKSGLMELTYSTGAKVILQGPCDFTVESPSSGFLQVGKMVAKVESQESRVERKAESGKRKVEYSRLSTLDSRLFAVRTPTATVEDLGTEFGVEVLDNGETASHVFAGRVVMRTEGGREKGEGRESENDKSEIQNPPSEILLSAGQSARVAKGAGGNALERLADGKAPPKFARRLLETPAELDLLDIVCGGNGAGHRREMGIDQSTGGRRTVLSADYRRGDGRYWPVAGMGLINGVFVPDDRAGAVQLDSAGHVCDEFPKAVGAAFGLIWARAAEVADKDRDTNWIYALADAEKFMPRRKGMLAFHANTGITFDLEVMRKIYRDALPAEFHAVVGLGDPRPFSASADGNADFWVFVDGQAKFKRTELRQRDGAVEVRVVLGPKDRFLTLAATDAGDGNRDDCMVVGDPTIKLNPIEPATRKEGR